MTRDSLLDWFSVATESMKMLQRVRVTPLAQRMATALGVQADRLRGSGPDGRVRKADVLRAQRGAGAAEPRALLQPSLIGPGQGLPQALTAVEVDMGAVAAYRAQHGAAFARRRLELSDLACLLAVLARVLPAYPLLNAGWSSAGIVRRRRLHIQVFEGERSGIIADVSDLTLRGVARQLHELAQPAVVASFSVRALRGSWGGADPLPAGQSASLSLGPVLRRAVCAADTLTIRPQAIVALTYDIRVLDQQHADQFLMNLQKELASFAG